MERGIYPVEEYDERGNLIHFKYSPDKDGDYTKWVDRQFDEYNNLIKTNNSDSCVEIRFYDGNNNVIYYEYINYRDNKNYWFKREFDENNKEVYYENSNLEIMDKTIKYNKDTVNDIPTVYKQVDVKELSPVEVFNMLPRKSYLMDAVILSAFLLVTVILMFI